MPNNSVISTNTVWQQAEYIITGNLTISQGATLEIEEGSIIKMASYRIGGADYGAKIIVEGILIAEGTNTDNVIITHVNDPSYGGIPNNLTAYNYWKGIEVSAGGEVSIENALLRYMGVNYLTTSSNYDLCAGNSFDVLGEIELKDTIVSNTFINEITFNGNIVNIQNCTFDKRIILNNISGSVKVNDNTFPEGITFIPYGTATTEIKNNIITGNSYVVTVNPYNAESDTFAGISGNINTANSAYNYIYITNNLNNNIKLTSENSYVVSHIEIPQGKIMEIEAGTTVKIQNQQKIYVKGTLICNGTLAKNVIITSESDTSYCIGILIDPLGKAYINNLTITRAGYYANTAIECKGQLYITNSYISDCNGDKSIWFNNTSFIDQFVHNNYITTKIVSNVPIDATYNYWGNQNGPQVTMANNIYTYPYNATFIKTNETWEEVFKRQEIYGRTNYGRGGVDAFTGNYSKQYTDLELTNPNIDLSFTRTYNSKNKEIDILGKGWSFGFKAKVEDLLGDGSIQVLYVPNGSTQIYRQNTQGQYIAENSRNTLELINNKFVLTSKDQIKYHFNANGYLEKIVDKYGNITNITVNGNGNITRIEDYANREYNLAYNQDGKLINITDPIGRIVTYSYDSNGLLTNVTEVNGKNVIYEYNTDELLISIKETGNIVEEITYLKNNLYMNYVNTVKNSNGKIDTYTYTLPSYYTTITDQYNKTTRHDFDKEGYIKKITYPGSYSENFTYLIEDEMNKYGERLSHLEVNGAITTYDRDSKGNIIKETHRDNSFKQYFYNTENSLTKEIDELGVVTDYIYDLDGVTLLEIIKPLGDVTTFEYVNGSIKGLVEAKTNGMNTRTEYAYDQYGNIIEENTGNNIKQYSYNVLGWLTEEIDEMGNITSYEHNNSGEITKITKLNSEVTNIEYNINNKPTKITDPKNRNNTKRI